MQTSGEVSNAAGILNPLQSSAASMPIAITTQEEITQLTRRLEILQEEAANVLRQKLKDARDLVAHLEMHLSEITGRPKPSAFPSKARSRLSNACTTQEYTEISYTPSNPMSEMKRQLNDAEKEKVLLQQRRDGHLRCFIDDHPIEDESDVEFHHIRPYSDEGPTDINNIGVVCKSHHKRIRTLSLSEFRDHLALEELFQHPEPRRLNDLLEQKLTSSGFGHDVVTELKGDQIDLHFINPPRPKQTVTVFQCPATTMRYFYAVLPIEYITNDPDLQPRPLEQKRLWELYRHLSSNTQLAPAVCRMVGKRILLFDGQHKSAAQIWAGRKTLDTKVYIEPDIRLLKDTNLVAHDKLRQMAFFTSTLIAKYSDIFKELWEEYVEKPGIKTESGFVVYLRGRGKTALEAKKMLMMAIEQDVLDDKTNRMAEFIADRNRTRTNPLTIAILQKTFFKDYVLAPPTEVEIEGPDDFRAEERLNLVRLLSIIADKQMINKWNPDNKGASHQKAERIFGAGAIRAWAPMLKDVIAQVLQLYDVVERSRLLFRKITDTQWILIEGRIDQLFLHKIWDDPDPNIAAQLSVNAVEQVRTFMASQGLTVNWILGGQGS